MTRHFAFAMKKSAVLTGRFSSAAAMVIGLSALSLPTKCIAQLPATTNRSAYQINETYSAIRFEVYKWMVMREEGMFRQFRGRIVYDPSHPEADQIELTVRATSIDTGNKTRDNVLRSDDFFDVSKYETLHFVSERVLPKAENQIEVSGALTIHGVTKQVTVPVRTNGTQEIRGVGTLAGFETTFRLDRTVYGVNGFRWSGGTLAISKEVLIHLALGCVRE